MSASASLTDTNLSFTDSGANTGVILFSSDEFNIDKAVTLTSDLKLVGATSGSITMNAADTTTSYGIKMPNAQGSSDAVLTNDGAGNLTWGLGNQKLVWAIQGVLNLSPTPTSATIIPLNTLVDGSASTNYPNLFSLQEYNSAVRAVSTMTFPNTGWYQIRCGYIHPANSIIAGGTQQSSGTQNRLYLVFNGVVGNIVPFDQEESSGNVQYANQGTLTKYCLSGETIRFYWDFQNNVWNEEFFISASISQWMI